MNKIIYIIIIFLFICCKTESQKENTQIGNKHQKLLDIEMIKPIDIELSEEILKNLNPSDIIYAEVAESGAMGNVGGIIVYRFKGEQLIRYKTDISINVDLYLATRALLIKHQNSYEVDTIKTDRILFDYHYGGMGNHVFINKNASLKIADNFFIYLIDSKKYEISPSVLGVFNSVVYSLEHNNRIKK